MCYQAHGQCAVSFIGQFAVMFIVCCQVYGQCAVMFMVRVLSKSLASCLLSE